MYNEATAWNYINPFMIEAVTLLLFQSKYQSLQLTVQEDISGSCAYGHLDYMIFCDDIMILVTETKFEEMQKGIAQNLMQLHTAMEVHKNLHLH